jgi:hypothetical protein
MSTAIRGRAVLSLAVATLAAAFVVGSGTAPVLGEDLDDVECSSLEHIKVAGTAALASCRSGAHRGRDTGGSGRPTTSTIEVAQGLDLTNRALFVLVRAESSHFSAFEITSLREFADSLFADVRNWEDTGREGSFETAALEGKLGDQPEYSSCAVFLHQFGGSLGAGGYDSFFGGFLCGIGGNLAADATGRFLENVSY